ncbi:MAG: hypothetical protein AAGC46_06185 [Solirubrobacteraceae bacterium]|nr:hypothetical protein [Patulibacter sp.]
MTQPVTDERRARLEQRIGEYHGQDLAAVLDLIDYLRDEDGGDTVIAGGSLSIDQGNRESDLDMVVVGAGVKTSAVPLEHWVGSLRVDAWTRSVADVDALFLQAEEALASDAPLSGAFGNAVQEQQLKLLHRIAFGLVVDGAPVRPASARGPVELALDLLTREYAERARESAMVAGLALAAGRDLTAATVARVGAEEALHAVLHGRGAAFSGDKWLSEQLIPMPDLQALHEEVAILPARGEPLGPYAERALTIIGELLGLDVTPAALGCDLSWSYSGLTLLPLAGRKVLASKDHAAAWELDDAEASAWADLSGGEVDGTFPHPTDAPAAEALCASLYEQGVLKLAWRVGVPLGALTLPGIDPEGSR